MSFRQLAAMALSAAVFLPPLTASAQDAPIPKRTPLAVLPVAPAKPVSRLETTRVEFLPGQVMPIHMHTVPVVCFIAKGDFLVKIGDEPEHRAPQGSVTLEPAKVTVHYFKNASATEPAQLLCASLAGDQDVTLTIMLDAQGR